MSAVDDDPVVEFKSPRSMESWLAKNHAKSAGVWLRIFKKHSVEKSVTYAEALDVALCYGWIDGLKRKYDDASFLQRFTPRRGKGRSAWSKVNTGHAERLIEAKRMKPAGLREIEAAKSDGRWSVAYEPQKTMEVPADFIRDLKKSPEAYEFFRTLNRVNLYAIAYRLGSAKKPETRERRKKTFIEMLAKGEKLH